MDLQLKNFYRKKAFVRICFRNLTALQFLVPFILAGVAELAWAQKATLVEDLETDTQQVGRQWKQKVKAETKRHVHAEAQEVENEVRDSYESAFGLRSHRRMAVGTEVMGQLGLIGGFIELNFAADDSATLGFGVGPQYASFAAGWRHVFGGQRLSPFVGLGFAHWYANGLSGTAQQTTPQYLSEKFLTAAERDSDRFALDLLTPAVGMQYNILSGSYTGTSFYAQLILLTGLRSLTSPTVVPTASVGALYYF